MKNMRFLHLIFIACALSSTVGYSQCKIVWTEGEKTSSSGKAIHKMEIQNPPKGDGWTIWFSQFRTPVTMMEGSQGDIVHISGTLYRVVPQAGFEGETLAMSYKAKTLVNRGRAPEGFVLQTADGKKTPLEVSYVYLPAEEIRSFDYEPVQLSEFDMIPALKDISFTKGTVDLNKAKVKKTKFVKGQKPGWYKITIDKAISIEAADADGEWYANITLENIKRNSKGEPVSCAVITDWPDLAYRGMMLDVSRNFTTKDNLLKLIDILAHYKASYLHLHFGDDEGWRIEIKKLPELTSYGAFRGIPTLMPDGSITEPDALQITYCSTLDRNDATSSGNGYYSHEDFVEILRYAASKHMKVIPEFDTPGHSRAAIKSMEVRALRTGDVSCLLSEPEDKSKYVSVQDYTDNAINVALPSTYKFIETVFDGLIAMYKEAGVPLEAIHVGGDEVPDGAWKQSPACQALMEANGKTDIGWLKEYFIGRVLDIAEARGVKIAGWQEVAQHLGEQTFARLKKNMFMTNLWAVSRGRDELAYQFANQGIPVVLSNSSNFYFDLAYNDSKLERGHSWAGFADERRSFSFLPYNMYRSVRWDDHRKIAKIDGAEAGKTALEPEGKQYIIGVQGQLWTETIRNFDHVTYYLFPKACGMFERGWNATPVWEDTSVSDDPSFVSDFNRFFSIIHDYEYPWYKSIGISYHEN